MAHPSDGDPAVKPAEPTITARWRNSFVDQSIKYTAKPAFVLAIVGGLVWGGYEIAKPRIAREVMKLITTTAHFDDQPPNKPLVLDKEIIKSVTGNSDIAVKDFVIDTYKNASVDPGNQIAYFEGLGANLNNNDLLKAYAKGVVQALVQPNETEGQREALRARIREIIHEELVELESVRTDFSRTQEELKALLSDDAPDDRRVHLRSRIRDIIREELARLKTVGDHARRVDSILRERISLYTQYFSASDEYCQNKEVYDPLLRMLPGRRLKEDITFYAHPGQKISILANESQLISQICTDEGKIRRTDSAAELEVAFRNAQHNRALNKGQVPTDITRYVGMNPDAGLQPITIGIQYRNNIETMQLIEAEIIILVENVDTKTSQTPIITNNDSGLGN